MTDRKFYKTVFKLEVLSEEPIPPGMEWEHVINEAKEGDYCMRELGEKETVLNGKQAARALLLHGSIPDFFRLTKDGNDLE